MRYPCVPEQRRLAHLDGLNDHCYLLRTADMCRVSEPPSLMARILNLSRGGLALHVGLHLQLGESVFAVLRCGARNLQMECRVVRLVEQHNGTFLVGIEFEQELDDEPLHLLAR